VRDPGSRPQQHYGFLYFNNYIFYTRVQLMNKISTVKIHLILFVNAWNGFFFIEFVWLTLKFSYRLTLCRLLFHTWHAICICSC
jgi:hypothetical protein